MILGFGNNVVSSLASDITSGQTSIPVMPGEGKLFADLLTSDFSNSSTTLKNYAKITLTDVGETVFEICHLTAVSGDNLTVIRGQEGTVARGWSLKDVIANFATRGSENSFVQIGHIQSGFYTAGTAGGTANSLTLELPSTFFINGDSEWEMKAPVLIFPSQNNTGAATLQLTLGGKVLGIFPLQKGNAAELVAGDIVAGLPLVCVFDPTKKFIQVCNPVMSYGEYLPITGGELKGRVNGVVDQTFIQNAPWVDVSGNETNYDNGGYAIWLNGDSENASYHIRGRLIGQYDWAQWVMNYPGGSQTLEMRSTGEILFNGQALYSPTNPPPLQDLSNYYTKSEVDARYIQGFRQSGVMSLSVGSGANAKAGAGGVVIGAKVNGDWDNNEVLYYTWQQQNINGEWVTIGRE